MPSFFAFETGSERRGPTNDSTPLLGRFRAVPDAQRQGRRGSHRNSLLLNFGGTGTFGRGISAFLGDDVDNDEGEFEDQDVGAFQRWGRTQRDLWLDPKQAAVGKIVDKWYFRWAVLIFLPAALAVAWCALPFPQYDLAEDIDPILIPKNGTSGHKVPGHGETRVEVNFWFFLFVYYGFYNLTALMWITKVFNIYSLNWWPESFGFPVTIWMIAIISIAVPIPIYYFPELRFITTHNTAWICWTFFTMGMPLILAFTILLNHERHLGLRNSLSETQRIFTSSWWTGDVDTQARRDRRRPNVQQNLFDPNAPLEVSLAADSSNQLQTRNLALRKRWVPASFMRFLWFCAALYIAMLAYVLGEAYAESYLRSLPHPTYETIAYVYTWVITIHLLDGLTGWILGGNAGERVGSYPLGWIFKLYFLLTYQTYVRALYARLRSPEQFIYLQILSSSFLIILGPLTMSKPFHYILVILGINGQTLQSYQKFCARNIYLRSLAECVSMVAFLGSILVLHYGSNKDVYPYFAFDQERKPSDGGSIGDGEDYDFGLTFYASIVTFACEIVAAWIVRRILWIGWKMNVTAEAMQDLATWPELLPTGVIVMVHVLQNMFFSIVRLKFH